MCKMHRNKTVVFVYGCMDVLMYLHIYQYIYLSIDLYLSIIYLPSQLFRECPDSTAELLNYFNNNNGGLLQNAIPRLPTN